MSIIGVGLLGGSIGLAARSSLNDCRIVGYGHRPQTLRRAEEIGAIDEGYENLAKSVESADRVVLCTPVGLFEQMLQGIAPHLKRGSIVTDVGSTKRSVVDLATRILPSHSVFVGSHPMAGSEKRGVEFARADLFNNATCIVTPTPQTPSSAVDEIENLWKALGMRICRMSPAAHDQALAAVSHLPHAVAAALVRMQHPDSLKLAGKGFLDTTRIAGGDGSLWRDIFLDNADNTRLALVQLRQVLDQFESMLNHKDGAALAKWLDETATTREALVQAKLKEINPD